MHSLLTLIRCNTSHRDMPHSNLYREYFYYCLRVLVVVTAVGLHVLRQVPVSPAAPGGHFGPATPFSPEVPLGPVSPAAPVAPLGPKSPFLP